MDFCNCGAVLAFALDYMHGVTCFEVRQMRDEALKRWLDDGSQSNFEKIWHPNVDESQPDRCGGIPE